MKPPPGAIITAIPVASDDCGKYAVSVGVVTLTTCSLSSEPSVVSGCFHCSEPGATFGQRLMTFFVTAGVGDCSGLVSLVSCARAALKREAAISQSAMKNL